jgi:predicted DNA-binding protein YlxM (UPF0122 family)
MIALSDSQKDEITTMAGLNFTVPVIAKRLDIPYQDLYDELLVEGSDFKRAYERGVLAAKVDKEKAIYDKMKEGNITAIQLHDKKEKEARLAEAKQRIFGRS